MSLAAKQSHAGSSGKHQLPGLKRRQKFNDIMGAAVAYKKVRNVCAHSCGKLIGISANHMDFLRSTTIKFWY
jgi:hypothetical protein